MSMLKTLERCALLPGRALHQALDGHLWPRLLPAGVRGGGGLRLHGRPQVKVGPGAAIELGRNVQLYSAPGSNPLWLRPCCFTVRGEGAVLKIGSETAMSGTVICVAREVIIGDRVLVGANSTIVDTDFHPLSPLARREHRTQGALCRPVRIGDDVFIGAGVTILKGSQIGAGCVVGAGAVVAGKFPPNSIIAGNPAQVVRALPVEQHVAVATNGFTAQI